MNTPRESSLAGDGPQIRPSILAAKQRLADSRQQLRHDHNHGAPGLYVCNRLADLLDGVILDIFEEAVEAAQQDCPVDLLKNIALVALGGYGRRDVAPFSDVDLILLHDPKISQHLQPLARHLVSDLSDLKLNTGFALRTPQEAVLKARRDVVIFTAQMEARFLSGSVRLFYKFMHPFRRDTRRRMRQSLARIETARHTERAQYGDTVFLLEPDIKKSTGGLRDIHLIRWVAFARHGESSPANLRLMGVLRNEDARALRLAHEFLLRLRNELHFHAGRPYDILIRSEQLRIAEEWRYETEGKLLPLQQFMRDYFRHTGKIRSVSRNFVASARARSMIPAVFAPLVSYRVDDHYRVGPIHVSATKEGLRRLQGNLAEVLRLMGLANQTDKLIVHETWDAIRDDMSGRADMEVSEEAARRFMSLLSYTARLGRLLHRLHEMQVLEKLVAGMDHASHLLQFNQYHKYTVDEHSLQAVECATEFFSDTGPLGKAYRAIKKRALLHLALLIHDLGKGYEEEHCIVGKRLAAETAKRLKLPHQQSKLLQFLVEKHLMMSHLAFRRDTSDEALILQFAQDVGTPTNLRMLFVLTAADLAAVGPGVLNPWKVEVLSLLFQRTMHHLGGRKTSPADDRLADERRAELLRSTSEDSADSDWYLRQIRVLPAAYLADNTPQVVLSQLQEIRGCISKPVVWATYHEDRNIIQYVVGLGENDAYRSFHRITGTLTNHGQKILTASVDRLRHAVGLARFYVEDHDFSQEPPPGRLDWLRKRILESIADKSDEWPRFRQVWEKKVDFQTDNVEKLPTRVEFDTSTLSAYTVVDVFAHDRVSLLYCITRVLNQLEVLVHFTNSGTYKDQVVDVFYVTDKYHHKIEDARRLAEIRLLLLAAIESG